MMREARFGPEPAQNTEFDMVTWQTPRILGNLSIERKVKRAISGLKNPVEIMLARITVLSQGNVGIEKLVLEYGCPFVGIARPKGYRQWTRKQCFRNAATLADRGQGIYCEGFVISPGSSCQPFHHAWITLDGKEAIDVTLPDAAENLYFGIPFPEKVFARLFRSLSVEQRAWPCFIDLPLDGRVVAALKEMRNGGLL
jgi:hypothetical protein